MSIVLDLAWGASVEIGPSLFKQLGAEVICLHDLPDGDRINVNCGSTNLSKLQEAVLTHNADLGFAFDGDADRVMAVDNKGRVVNGDYILYLWGKSLKDSQQLPGDLIVATVMANLGFERAWEQLGGETNPHTCRRPARSSANGREWGNAGRRTVGTCYLPPLQLFWRWSANCSSSSILGASVR